MKSLVHNSRKCWKFRKKTLSSQEAGLGKTMTGLGVIIEDVMSAPVRLA